MTTISYNNASLLDSSPVIVKYTQTATQTIASSNNSQYIEWTSAEEFENGGFTLSTGVRTNDTVTIPRDGIYQVIAYVRFEPLAAGSSRLLSFYINGTQNMTFNERDTAFASASYTVDGSQIYSFSANDTLRVRVFQDSGSNINIGGAVPFATTLSIHRLL